MLQRHVVQNLLLSKEISKGNTTLDTVGGEQITVTKTDDEVTIQSSVKTATVLRTDLLARNGVIHIVDSVF